MSLCCKKQNKRENRTLHCFNPCSLTTDGDLETLWGLVLNQLRSNVGPLTLNAASHYAHTNTQVFRVFHLLSFIPWRSMIIYPVCSALRLWCNVWTTIKGILNLSTPQQKAESSIRSDKTRVTITKHNSLSNRDSALYQAVRGHSGWHSATAHIDLNHHT